MMQQLGWNTLDLEVRRNQARAVVMYRIVSGLIAVYIFHFVNAFDVIF